MEINDDILREATIVYLDREGHYDILSSDWYIKNYKVMESGIHLEIMNEDIEGGWRSHVSTMTNHIYTNQLRIERNKKIDRLLD